MKQVITFLTFIVYATLIFFTPNMKWCIIIPFLINAVAMIGLKISLKKALKNLWHIIPFILITGIINLILEGYTYAFYISIKLILVCNATYIYSRTTTTFEIAKTVKVICAPLKIFKVNTDDIEILVALALSMIPVLKKEAMDLKNACIAKNIDWNIKNMKIILSKFLVSIIKRVNEIDEALMEKGYESQEN